jgi:hypothetical protein
MQTATQPRRFCAAANENRTHVRGLSGALLL